MVAIKEALRSAEGKANLDELTIGSGVKATLQRVMPIYRKYWWPEHDRTNRAWIAAVRPLLDRHGAALNEAITRAYDVSLQEHLRSVLF